MTEKEKQQQKNEQLHMVNVCAGFIALAVVGVLALLLPKPEVSEIEKRELAKKPQWSLSAWFSGEFADDYDAYYADTFPGREGFVSMASRMETMRGLHPDEVRIHQAAPQQPTQTNPSTQEPVQPSREDAKQQFDETAYDDPNAPGNGLSGSDESGEQAGSLFLYQNMGMQIFGANETMSRRYAEVISSYARELPEVQVYNLIAPTSIAFYLPDKYQKIASDEKENIEFISSCLTDGVKAVDAYSEIEKKKDEYIYFRTDHHWTVRGAYAAYLAFCRTAGLEPTALDKMEHRQIDNFVGTFYNQTQDKKLSDTPDFVEYFVPLGENETTRYVKGQPFDPIESTIFAGYATGGQNTYSVFLHGDFPLTHIKTENKTGRKVMLVKESFGNAFAPFLANNYDEVFIVDQRYFELNLLEFIRENGITDLLFLNNIFAANTEVRINELERIQNQTYVPYVAPPVTVQPVEEKPEPKQEEPQPKAEEKSKNEKPKTIKKVTKKTGGKTHE